jgi:P2X purinoceptor 4
LKFILLVLLFLIRYDIILNKGYQQFDSVASTVSTKVKGLGYLNESGQSNSTIDNLLIFDTADYVIPPNENSAIFIMTNFIETIQTRGVCEAVN